MIGTAGAIPSVVMTCAAIYLTTAVVGRPWSVWLVLLGFAPLTLIGRAFNDTSMALLLVGSAQVIVVVVGIARRQWGRPHNLAQLVAAAIFAAVAVLAASEAPVVGTIALAVGLIGHGLWDVAHHRSNIVVTRGYSAFCAGLDFALVTAVLIASAHM